MEQAMLRKIPAVDMDDPKQRMNLRGQSRNVLHGNSASVVTTLVSTARQQPGQTAMLSSSSRRTEADIPPPEVPAVPEIGSPEVPDPATATPENPEIGTPEVPAELPADPAPEAIPETTPEAPDVPVVTQPPDALSTKAPDNLSPGTPLQNKNDSPSCNTLSCQGLSTINEHPVLYIILFLLVSCICCLRCKLCCRRERRDPRGEYRAVGRMLETNFDTELTEEDMNFYASDEDDDEPTVGSSAYANNYIKSKGTIELGNVGEDEINGGLTLEEMNG